MLTLEDFLQSRLFAILYHDYQLELTYRGHIRSHRTKFENPAAIPADLRRRLVRSYRPAGGKTLCINLDIIK